MTLEHLATLAELYADGSVSSEEFRAAVQRVKELAHQNGYCDSMRDVLELLKQRVPITPARMVALEAAYRAGLNREARIKAAWEAA